jgi:transcriptional regulator with XRE-family HTH domain
MEVIYLLHSMQKQGTIDDLLLEANINHQEYRRWLKRSKLPMYKMTKGLYEEALVSEDPKYYFYLTNIENNKVLYSKGWTEPRKSLTDDISAMLNANPNSSQEYIAVVLGVTQARVSQVARQFNLRKERKKRTLITVEDVRKLHHLDAHQIAKKLNVSMSTVYKKMSECKNI